MLDGTNYTNWSGRLKVHLRGKGLWYVCMAGLSIPSLDKDRLSYVKAKNKAITIIVPRFNVRVYNEVVKKDTIDYVMLLWDKIASQYTSHLVVNYNHVYMRWSNLLYDCDLQAYINKTCASLLDIETVNITISKELV
jgi:hypothetical protein